MGKKIKLKRKTDKKDQRQEIATVRKKMVFRNGGIKMGNLLGDGITKRKRKITKIKQVENSNYPQTKIEKNSKIAFYLRKTRMLLI